MVGRMPGSFLAQERGFETREREFRREMEALHSSTHSELLLQVGPHSIPHDVYSIPGGAVSRQAVSRSASTAAINV